MNPEINDSGPAAQSVHFSSATSEWPTPQPLFAALDREFGFDLDPCATDLNAKCARYFTLADDGLAQSWGGAVVFMNPPYGRVLRDWVRKAHDEARAGATVVGLIPARTDTTYWHEHVMKAAELRLIRGRLHFEGAAERGHNAPFPSAVVVWRPGVYGPPVLGAMGRAA